MSRQYNNNGILSSEEYYRRDYYKIIDNAIEAFDKYFNSTDIALYKNMEHILNENSTSLLVLERFPEINISVLDAELKFYSNTNQRNFISMKEHFKTMPSEMRMLFPNIEKLIRLLMISPASSCEAERSFSGLRRIKTWLRSTMGQRRLNALMVCNVHQDILEDMNIDEIIETFIENSFERRSRKYGK